jgi:uncharacterized protein YggU (UPF0235/DUF167 family)
LGKFLTSVKEGKAEANVKSEPIPGKGDAALITAVAKNFDEVVEITAEIK